MSTSWSDWKVGSVVDAGFIKGCVVEQVHDNPPRYYLYTPNRALVTFFPYRGVRSGWVSEPDSDVCQKEKVTISSNSKFKNAELLFIKQCAEKDIRHKLYIKSIITVPHILENDISRAGGIKTWLFENSARRRLYYEYVSIVNPTAVSNKY